jgi:hypothetical protein
LASLLPSIVAVAAPATGAQPAIAIAQAAARHSN